MSCRRPPDCPPQSSVRRYRQFVQSKSVDTSLTYSRTRAAARLARRKVAAARLAGLQPSSPHTQWYTITSTAMSVVYTDTRPLDSKLDALPGTCRTWWVPVLVKQSRSSIPAGLGSQPQLRTIRSSSPTAKHCVNTIRFKIVYNQQRAFLTSNGF